MADPGYSCKDYKITSVSDFLVVPEERLPACLEDFAVFLTLGRRAQGFNALVQHAMDLPPGSTEFRSDVFRWVDDGKPGLSGLNFETEDGRRVARVDLDLL